MEKIGNFIQNQSNLPNFKLIPGKRIMWINGFPPNDEPDCGFEGCPIDKSFIILCALSITLLAFICAFLTRFPFFNTIISVGTSQFFGDASTFFEGIKRIS